MTTNTMTCYEKTGNTWEKTYNTDDKGTVFEMLASVLWGKYIGKRPGIARVEDRPDYATGNRVVTVYECGAGGKIDYKRVFNVAC